MFFSRDRFGEKPLFYMRKQNEFYFGSEIKFIKCLYEKKLLLNSFKKCEEYINETSVELFLNCSDKKKSNKNK